ncbi:MAG: hypothetical protein J0L92_21620 [Deltaproteobacteria bacterium]|nr:hypothetical protein [Deltaproteobacteria bacterium]
MEFEATVVENSTSLAQSLGLDVSASYRWGFGSVSASFSYATSSEFNSRDVFVVVRTSITNSTRALSQPALTPEAIALYTRDAPQFTRTCGDEFVTTITSGGELVAVLRIRSSSSADRESIRAALRGNYMGFNAAADLQTSLASLQSSHETSTRIVRSGGSGALPDMAPSALLEFARVTFPTLVASHAIPRQYSTASYETIPSGMNFADRIVRASLIRLAERLDQAIQRRNDTMYTRDNSALCTNSGSAQIAPRLGEFDDYIDAISAHALECTQHPERACPRFAPVVPAAIACAEAPPVATRVVAGPYNMQAPVHYDLPGQTSCRGPDRVTGLWTESGSRPPYRACGNDGPGVSVHGTVAGTGEFEQAGHYYDNNGDCRYEFVCCPNPFVPHPTAFSCVLPPP